MLCDKCGGRVTPVFVSDIDGTLGDYYSHFRDFAEGYWCRPMHRDWNGVGNWEDHLGMTQQEYRQTKLAYRQGGMKRNLPLYGDTLTFMDRLNEMGVDIWLATTRPYQRLDNIDPDTKFWVDKHGWTIAGLLYGDDKFQQICQAVDPSRIIGVVDDLVENLLQAAMLGLPTFQVKRDHNRGTGAKWDRRGSLYDAATWAAERLQDWQKEHA